MRADFSVAEMTPAFHSTPSICLSNSSRNDAGFRKVPGTALKDFGGNVVYTPPSPDEIEPLMRDLERFVNDPGSFAANPLIKMALIHHRFETIHPFYDGNGRTGRIINVMYLVNQGLLDIPVLYMSRHIVRTKSDYYRLLQDVRERDAWEEWVVYMLTAVEETASDGLNTVLSIRGALFDYKHRIRASYKFYSQDLINNLFSHPYTKIQFIERDLGVSRLTSTRYLDALAHGGFLQKHKIGRSNYYINLPLYEILTGESMTAPALPAASKCRRNPAALLPKRRSSRPSTTTNRNGRTSWPTPCPRLTPRQSGRDRATRMDERDAAEGRDVPDQRVPRYENVKVRPNEVTCEDPVKVLGPRSVSVMRFARLPTRDPENVPSVTVPTQTNVTVPVLCVFGVTTVNVSTLPS
jgi:hypothetical protein